MENSDKNYRPEYAIAWATWFALSFIAAGFGYLVFSNNPTVWVLALGW